MSIKIRQKLENDGIFCCLIAILFLFHLGIKPGGDDIGRISSYSVISYKDVLIDTWNFCQGHPRYFTYFIVGTLCHLKFGFFIWKILDCVILYIIVKSISYLFVSNKKLNILVALLFSMYPFSEMITAGALSTTVGYTWVLASALLSLVFIKKASTNNLKWYEIILFIASTIYGTGQEQMCIVFLCIFSAFSVYFMYRKNKYLFLLSFLAEFITCCNAFFLFRGAINGGRNNEIIYFCDFNSLTFIDKFEMAFSSTLDRVFYTNYIVLLLTAFILLILWQKSKNKICTLIAAISFTFTFIGSVDWNIFKNVHDAINTDVSDRVKYGLININNYYLISSYLPLFVLCLTGILTLVGLYLIGNNLKESLISITMLFLGMMTRMMLMVTVNIYASSTRTYLFLWFSIICVTLYIADNNYKNILYPLITKNHNTQRFIQLFLPIIIVILLINNMLICIR